MNGYGRVIGLLLTTLGLVAGLVGGLWLWSGSNEGRITASAMLLGLGLLIVVIVLPLVGAGLFFWLRGRSEARERAHLDQQRRLLDIVATRGKVRISDLVLELGITKSQVRDAIYELVGQELFAGYVDWRGGLLYSAEAGTTQTRKCPNCGAPREVAGKGIVKCPFCGAETFLSRTSKGSEG